MSLYEVYQQGKLQETLDGMSTKDIMKSFRRHCFGIPSRNREKLIKDFMARMERDMNKGHAFMRQ